MLRKSIPPRAKVNDNDNDNDDGTYSEPGALTYGTSILNRVTTMILLLIV